MDDDSLDELVVHSPGPDGPPRVGLSELASEAEESSNDHSGDSEDETGSEHEDDTDGEETEGLSEEEDPEDRSGSEDSEDGVEMSAAAMQTQGKLDASSAPNSDDDAESCPICLNAFRDQAVGTPETCAHYFCLDCIIEWSRNANSCPVDRTIFKCICIRAQFNGKILKKIPVENTRACEDEEAEEEDPTFCEVCGRSDREDRLLLCDGCDAGYHMECLDPPLQEVPVDEWFCPECAAPAVDPTHDAVPVSDEEVSMLLADVVPTTSRLRPPVIRTRAIARTRQSERVRATVNRNRISSARRVQHVPRYLMSSLLDETIEAVATGLSTAVYQRPLTPRVPAKRKRKAGRRKKVPGRKKTRSRSSVKSRSGGTRAKKRQHRVRKTKGKKLKNEVTARSRIARTLGLGRPVRGTSMPSVYKPVDPSLGLMRADIGAASLSLFGDPYELDPFDSVPSSNEEPPADPPSPLSAKRRVLSRSALQSHQPVARPVAMGLSRRQLPAVAPEPSVEEAPVPDLLGSILSGQSLLMMSSADVVIHRDGSLSAKRAAPVSLQRSSVTQSREQPRPKDSLQPGSLSSGSVSSGLMRDRQQSSGLSCGDRAAPRCLPSCTVKTSVRVDSIFGTEMESEPQPPGEPVSGMLEFLSKGPAAKEASDMEQEGLREMESTEIQGSTARTQRPSPPDPWDDEDGVSCTPFFGSEERTVTCVTVMEPSVPTSPDAPQITTHRIVELRAPSRSRSTSSSRSRKKTKKKKVAREHQRTRSSTRSGSRDRASHSVSPVAEEHTKRHRPKAKGRRSSSDRASSQDRAKRRKDRDRERRRGPWGHGRCWRKSRSHSGSPGSSSCERRESRKRKRHHSGSRSRGRDCSPHSSLERDRRHKHRERSRERMDKKESGTRSRERRWRRSRSPSLEHRPRRPHSHEKRPHSPEKKGAVREVSPAPAPQGEPRQDENHPAKPPVSEVSVLPDVVVADMNPPEVPPVPAEPTECVPEDLDYAESVEAGHVFEEFSNEALFIQLDDMSSPPSPESTDSSPERDFPSNPIVLPASLPQDAALPAIQKEVLLAHNEDISKPAPQALTPSDQCLLKQDTEETMATIPNTPAVVPVGKDGPLLSGRECETVRPKDAVAQAPLLRSRNLVKRVTWNLQEAEDSTPALDRIPRTPLQRPQEGDWDAEDRALIGGQQAPFSDLPPPIHVLQESGLPDADPSQPPGVSRAEGPPAVGTLHPAGGILAQAYSPNMPPPLAQPSGILPYALVNQPSVQMILQGTLPLPGCGTTQSLAPVPSVPATTSELALPTNNNSEEKTATPKSAAEKTKKEEYMKKLHMQERAVEEVKLAIKPFYQKREVTKEEYKDILRKAVQKICHSKSGEINPVKVANLVKAYVDKYRHMRKHKKTETGEEPPTQGAAET
ncbi:PHD and RING finger domain-containing protein 1 isoform X1 [Sigmodon hispidus]